MNINHFIFVPPLKVKNEFYGHHAKPVTLAWSPDNEHFATGGMDMMVYVWTVADPDQRLKMPGWLHNHQHPNMRGRGRGLMHTFSAAGAVFKYAATTELRSSFHRAVMQMQLIHLISQTILDHSWSHLTFII